MTAITLCLIVGGIATAAGAALVFAGMVRTGQLDDLEEAKYRMFREDQTK